MSFAELLAAVGGVAGIRRVRFTTSHPRDFTREIVQAIDAMPTLCDHVHLPVQSGSTAVLKAMAREYTREWYLERIAWIKAARREISMTRDIIVGFPGETEARARGDGDAAGGGAVRRDLCVQVLAAAEYARDWDGGSIPDEEKSRRLQVLLDRQREIQRKSYARHLGQSDGGDGGGPQRCARAGGGAQLAEQDGELYGGAADPAGDGKLPAGEDHADVS